MKKLMFMLAAIACAVTLQAAQLDWSLDGKSLTKSDGTGYISGQTTYLLTFANSAAADTLYSQLKSGDKTTADAIAMAVGSAVGNTNTSKNQGKIAAATATHSSLTEGASYYGALLVVDGDKFILSATRTGMAYNPTGSVETEGSALSFAATAFSSTADSRTGWTTAAPEPTSGILMLIGLGALALRRRKA